MERTLNHLQLLKLPFGDVLIKLIISFLLFKKETHLEFLILKVFEITMLTMK